MRYGLPALGLTVLLLGSSLPPGGADPTSARADLDSFGDEQLERDLQDELDDILEMYDPTEDIDADEMLDEIMFALGDEGDESDPEESEIGFEDLEAEMAEDDTTLEDVVMEALGMAQADAGGLATRLAADIGVGLDASTSLVWGEATAIPRTVGVNRAWRGIFRAIRAR